MTESLIAEIVTFRAAASVTEAEMQQVACAIAPWLAGRAGFIARTLSYAPDGLWTDHVLWTDEASAMAAGQAIMAEPTAAALMASIAPDTVTMAHTRVVVRQTAA